MQRGQVVLYLVLAVQGERQRVQALDSLGQPRQAVAQQLSHPGAAQIPSDIGNAKSKVLGPGPPIGILQTALRTGRRSRGHHTS